ncbi:DNA-3-methyladenine glycosylase I [Allostreptomyces psammosilenae]|uniref:DNA-3-methyladenine glycosylase I n=1 Tax=Allostreptomyces psammosilenae TaxID=1892865 RepID=A0A853A0Y4_9ACTN|nr:DNA-3-methyladenine glycosylase I [Allostreptomyces psammosilenae]NYI04162.1 DNA-3-methyladenine glycosylase I [Allostreptomyces psammosilenae]
MPTTDADGSDGLPRCAWANRGPALMREYHDREWGIPVRDERGLFERLCLEGAQAGLSWLTILTRREAYRAAFAGFDVDILADWPDSRVEELLADSGIIRNRAKIASVLTNARAARRLREEAGGLDALVWGANGGVPEQPGYPDVAHVPAATAASEALSKELRRRGFRFVGPVIVESLRTAAGLVNAHTTDCFRHAELAAPAARPAAPVAPAAPVSAAAPVPAGTVGTGVPGDR